MQRTYCDRCREEIVRTRSHLVKHDLEITCVDEDAEGNLDSTTTLKLEMCAACRALVGHAIDESLLKRRR